MTRLSTRTSSAGTRRVAGLLENFDQPYWIAAIGL
jgi:hypothetical protein